MTPAAAGYSIVELLIGTGIAVTATALACVLASEAQAAWRADSARVDVHQRARVAADVLSRALRESGFGAGAARHRSLVHALPPVMPRRLGGRPADPPDRFRTDAVTLIRAIPEMEAAVLALPVPAGTSVLEIQPASVCTLPSCGLGEGSHVLLFDKAGAFDLFYVKTADGPVLGVQHYGAGSAAGYSAGTPVVAVEATSFFLDRSTSILRAAHGDISDLPLMDDVVGMGVEYFGESRAPPWPVAAEGVPNCVYAADGTYQAALMPVLSARPSLVPMRAELLTDGPWCGGGSTSFDADLLRVRRVRVTLRLQAADPAVRGSGARFIKGGTAQHSGLMVPDVVVTVEAATRNPGLGR